MLKSVSPAELARLLAAEYPLWDADALRRQAEEYVSTLDKRLDAPLRGYLDTGEPVNFRHGEFSILQIQWLRAGRSYLTAVTMMDAYLKDPLNGKALILRR